MPPIRLISSGYLHLPTGPDGSPVPPAADRIEDVRDRLRDPAASHDILDLDGLHPRVQDVVLNTPGARELLANLADYAALPAGSRRIAIGCTGGRHRGVDRTTKGHAERERIHRSAKFGCRRVHLHVDRSVIRRPTPKS
ncbi:RNase adapter RapZ [Streptomyces sp. NPDC050388]|uniref:RapZ C-terminal domain-containing protein n=1 Tax=Streptomyces sp. NPDC050388 TaxID=3155781 RepID=UPI00341B7424